MPQDHPRRCVNAEQADNFMMGISEDQPYQRHGRHTFHGIHQHCYQPGFSPQSPQGIGGSRVAASFGTDINPAGSPVNIRRLDQPEGVSDQQTDDSAPSLLFLLPQRRRNRRFYASFSFLSRTMNFSAVPGNRKPPGSYSPDTGDRKNASASSR